MVIDDRHPPKQYSSLSYCVALDDRTTRVTHAYEFTFRKPFRWIERRIAEPLGDEIEEEVTRLAEIIGKEDSTESCS
ncbi:MAG: hypothetical protein V3V01_02505 [Acidimicrobiales bacterium]